MTNTPLTSGEQSKVMIFVLLLLPTIIFLVGIIPTIFLIFGVVMMKRSSDFSHIETAVRNFRGYVMLMIAVSSLFALYFATTLGANDRWDRRGDEFVFSLMLTSAAVFYFVVCKKLFLEPLRRHREWVEHNGIFSSKARQLTTGKDTREVSIIGGEKLRSFSVADELLKWAKLKEDGHITEEEFNEARKKLLQGN